MECKRNKRNKLWFIGIGSIFLVLMILPYLHQHYCLSVVGSRRMSTGEKQVDQNCSADWLFESKSIHQDDPRMLNYIRKYHLTPPSDKPYALKNPNQDPSEFPNQILKVFKLDQPQKRKGFFIEAGALDGELLSNTLKLEKEYGWTGILIEPNPLNLVKLRLKNRKAWIMDVCISFTGSPLKILFNRHLVDIDGNDGWGMLAHSENNPLPRNTKYNLSIQPHNFVTTGFAECFPLFSILNVLNVTVVDYFSLDIQGPELKVLKSIPFQLITIKVISVEYALNPNGEEVISEFLKSKGYRVFTVGEEVFGVHKDSEYA